MLHNDHKYIEALLSNDSSMIEHIYQQHSASIKRMVLQNNGDEMDAADLFQEVLLELHKKAQNGFKLTCPLGGFLYLMCRSRWLNEIQKRKRARLFVRQLQAERSTATASTYDYHLHEKEDRQRDLVFKTLDAMGENNKRLLLLAFSKTPLKELANSMNLTYGYLRKKKTACISRLTAKVRQSKKFQELSFQNQ